MNGKNKKGFTLIEVITAVVVLSVGVSAIMFLIYTGLNVISATTRLTIKANLARVVMNQVENLYWSKKQDKVVKSGNFTDEYPEYSEYSYKVDILEDVDEKIPGLQQIDVSIYHNKSRNEIPFTISTYLIDFTK